ncbi:MAG: hypothetical protein COV74_02580 [Candidatus Omnitrophica bacterium CG11_big_fil_rev_8_21_14_0_20_45_26]|uniref:RNase H type-1 domain-containing protein n=1 Tax=Candidatus Abzuiibacterium crystallinum TaxID=1974748 RepID=A0A2H0LRP9_9BACT|nr:MAG: hypothetical protein COV74_02580 [Candidatus Omnitrophica bacterium CG11_big_fil_rev_8_21_14_0_20_45_26]PIW65720.1 MAG: hypothetical protein COW12_00425 [Candidatus Omnitrophica bacterium CG12_big_fil_rev_8_21_14_0_65_45_16]
MKLKIYTDGGARGNPGPAAIGVVVCNEKDEVVFEHQDTIGEATNNIAEYCALIAGLEIAYRLKAKSLQCYTDSQLLMNQMNGSFKIKTDHIRTLSERARRAAKQLDSVTYHHLPREHVMIKQADRLVNQALNQGGH